MAPRRSCCRYGGFLRQSCANWLPLRQPELTEFREREEKSPPLRGFLMEAQTGFEPVLALLSGPRGKHFEKQRLRRAIEGRLKCADTPRPYSRRPAGRPTPSC